MILRISYPEFRRKTARIINGFYITEARVAVALGPYSLAEIGTLPDADQEEIGRRLLSHVEKLRRLREEIDKGTRSLDAGAGKSFDITKFLSRKHIQDGAS